jgi:tetratricopeptide (TPR) repeat protein
MKDEMAPARHSFGLADAPSIAAWIQRPRLQAALVFYFAIASTAFCAPADALFGEGVSAYRASDYSHAAEAFRKAAALQPASGTLQNLGNAEWEQGQAGAAVLAWEQTLWLDPFNDRARNNLSFARKTAQLDTPSLAWYEVVSTWLPVNWWPWITGAGFWVTVGMVTLPGIFRRQKATWHQAAAALGLTVFLLSLPAHFGVHARSHLGFILQKQTPLKLTPTADAQVLRHLAAGEPARWERRRGNYILLRTVQDGTQGWVEQNQFQLICQGYEGP